LVLHRYQHNSHDYNIHPQCNERKREKEFHPIKYPQRPRYPALTLQPAPSYGNSPDVQLRSEATALEHRSTLAHSQQPTIAQDDSNPGMSQQHSKSSPTCARQLIIPWLRRSGAVNRVPFLQRTRPRHSHPGEQSATHEILYVLHTEIGNRFSPAIETGYTLHPDLRVQWRLRNAISAAHSTLEPGGVGLMKGALLRGLGQGSSIGRCPPDSQPAALQWA
jgi:hypothetical protein